MPHRPAPFPPRMRCACIAVAAVGLVAGCGTPVQPWQKGDLARPEMGFDPDRLDAAFVEHTYTSKEAASGGASVGGGGCGCN